MASTPGVQIPPRPPLRKGEHHAPFRSQAGQFISGNRLESLHELAGHPVAGPSFEGMVVENLIAVAGERRVAYFFRTQDGAEIDLVFAMGGVPGIAVEIKRASAPTLEKGFTIACEDLGIRRRYVVYPGRERFPIRHGAEAISLLELMELLKQ